MRDALGGLVNIAIIVVFLVIVSGYLAFNVNYTKAFRVKNKIISTIENMEGLQDFNDPTKSQVKAFESSIGYDVSIPKSSSLPTVPIGESKWKEYKEYGCYIREVADETGASGATKKKYYEVITFVTVDIPIIKKIMPQFPFFQVRGATKSIKVYN